MNSFTFLFLTAAAALTLLSPPSSAATVSLPKGVRGKVSQDTYFVTFPSPPGTPEAKVEQDNFRQELKQRGVEITERYAFSRLVNAISFKLKPKYLDQLSRLKTVKSVFPMIRHQPPRVISSKNNPKLKFAHGITGVAQVHADLGLSGKGIKVGVIDSGIDYTHPALGGCFGRGCKVAFGYDFVGDDYTGDNDPVPDNDPIDICEGHGTHVAGIIAAKDKDIVGVAPEVTLGAYRILGCDGSVSTDLIIAAMEMAFEDGMDVVSMSIGGASSWSEYPDAVAADALVKQGVVVVAAGGNDGEKGLWQSEAPGLGDSVISVASFDNVKFMSFAFSVKGLSPDFSYTGPSEKKAVEFPLDIELVRFLDDQGSDLGCAPLPLDLTGKLALIQRGNCSFQDKAMNAQTAKAAGVVIYNNVFGGFGVSVQNITIPVIAITQVDGKRLLEHFSGARGSLKANFKEEQQIFDTPTGGKISDFSSWGPSPLLRVKPDIGAPGGLIYSTFPVPLGAYATLSGTSMATPYISGAVALYLQAKGKVDPLLVRDALKNSAHGTKTWDGEFFASTFRQGAGMVDIKAALGAKTTVSPAALSLNSTDAGGNRRLHQLVIKNLSDKTKHYRLSHQSAVAIQPWDKETQELLPVPVIGKAEGKLRFPGGSLVIRPRESKTVQFSIDPPSGLPTRERWLYSGYILVQNEDESFSVPYGGMQGNYQSIKILPKRGSELPALISGFDKKTLRSPVEFSMKGNDTPAVGFRLLFPCRKVVVSLLDARGKEMGVINHGESDLLGQNDNSEDNLMYTQDWDGSYIKGNQTVEATDGKYALKLSVLKPYGDLTKSGDYETWTSMVFGVNRSLPSKGGDEESGESEPGVTLNDVRMRLMQANSDQVERAKRLAKISAESQKLILKKELE